MHSEQPESRKWFNLILFTVSLIPIILYGYVFVQRAFYPFDLEWAEGAALNQVNQILSGNPLYTSPSLTFAPLVYTPLYHYLSAGLSQIVGAGFFVMRLISITFSIGAAGLIYLIVKGETENPLVAWVSGAFYLACFEISDGFFDLARVDSTFIFIILLGLFISIKMRNRWIVMATGLIFAVAFYFKQTAVIVFLPLLIGLAWTNIKRYWLLLTTFGVGLILPWILLDWYTNDFFSFYTFVLPRHHGYSIISAANFWIGDIFEPLGIAVGFITFWVLSILITQRRDIPEIKVGGNDSADLLELKDSQRKDLSSRGKILLFACGALAAAWITRASNGGGANNVMVAYAAIALCLGLSVDFSIRLGSRKQGMFAAMYGFIPILLCIQFIGLIYNPFKFLPSRADQQINQNLLAEIEASEGEILIPYRSHLSVMTGKDPQIHIVNLFEFTGYFQGEVLPEGIQLVDKMRAKICNQDYKLISLDQPVPWFADQIDEAYDRVEIISEDELIEVGDKSQVCDWQLGYLFTYKPKETYQIDNCQQ